MNSRLHPDKRQTIEKNTKKVRRVHTEASEMTRTKDNLNKSKSRQAKSKTPGRNPSEKVSRYLRKKSSGKDQDSHQLRSKKCQSEQNHPMRSPRILCSKQVQTLPREDSTLSEASIVGNDIISHALESTKYVESKYLEVLSKMHRMKNRDKQVEDGRVKKLELAIGQITKENQHLKNQINKLENIVSVKQTDTAGDVSAVQVINSMKRFEEKEKRLTERIRELEDIVKLKSSGKEPQLESKPNDDGSVHDSSSKTVVGKLCRRDSSINNRNSNISNRTKPDRTPSPYNFKRLLNQAADQINQDPVMGPKASSGKQRSSKSRLLQNPLVEAGFSNDKLVKSHRAEGHQALAALERAVSQMMAEFRMMRNDNREVNIKLSHIEKVLDK